MPEYILNGIAAMGNDESMRNAEDEFQRIIRQCIGTERKIRQLGCGLVIAGQFTEKECADIGAAFHARFDCTLVCCHEDGEEPMLQGASRDDISRLA